MMRPTAAAAAMIALLGVAACGSSNSSPPNANAPEKSPPGDIPDNQAFVRFTAPTRDFSVKVPEGWSQQKAGHAVVFTDKLNAIRVESRPASGPPSVAAAKRAAHGLRAVRVNVVRRTAGTAVRTTYLAKAKVNPVTGRSGTDAVERYVFFHGGKDAVLTLSGPKGADNVDPWRLVTDSLRWAR
jgi:hypothetical protein